MRPIPGRMRSILERMPRMRACEIGTWHPELGACTRGKIEWHHVWIYAGAQVNELWAILGACEGHHDAVKGDSRVREAFERRSLEIASKEDLEAYPRKDWAGTCRTLGVSMPERIISEAGNTDMNKARQILLERVRELTSKALSKRKEADRLEAEALAIQNEADKLK